MRCPLCDSPETTPSLRGRDRLLETTPRVFHLSACRACDCLFIDPPPNQTELAAFYPEHYWRLTQPTNLSWLESVYRQVVLRDHVRFTRQAAARIGAGSQAARILDVGCGTGTFLNRIRRWGFEVTGVDLSPAAARIAETENGVKVRTGTLEETRFAPEHFDIVTMFHTLEHLAEPQSTLAEAHRVLKPHGRLIVQVPNIGSWQCRLLETRWHGLDIPRHTVDHSFRSLCQLLARCGFRAERTRHFNLRDNAPALASSVAPALDPVRRAVRASGGQTERTFTAWTRHLLYLGLVTISYPFALMEAAAGSGATIMMEARKA